MAKFDLLFQTLVVSAMLFARLAPAQTVEELQKRAEAGDAQAQSLLAGEYLAGRNVPKDFKTAAAWYHKAALQNHVHAQVMLGKLFARGMGVETDLLGAYAWFRASLINYDDRYGGKFDENGKVISPPSPIVNPTKGVPEDTSVIEKMLSYEQIHRAIEMSIELERYIEQSNSQAGGGARLPPLDSAQTAERTLWLFQQAAYIAEAERRYAVALGDPIFFDAVADARKTAAGHGDPVLANPDWPLVIADQVYRKLYGHPLGSQGSAPVQPSR